METVIVACTRIVENVLPDLVIAGYVVLGFLLGSIKENKWKQKLMK